MSNDECTVRAAAHVSGSHNESGGDCRGLRRSVNMSNQSTMVTRMRRHKAPELSRSRRVRSKRPEKREGMARRETSRQHTSPVHRSVSFSCLFTLMPQQW